MVKLLNRIHSPRTWFGRLALFGAGIMALLGGLALLELIVPGDPGDLGVFDGVSIPVIAALGFVVLAGEAVFFTIVPAEVSRRFLRRGWIGLLIGALAYSPLLHASNGWGGVVFSGWIVTVLGVVYMIQRPSSLWAAATQAIGLKWAFWIAALATIMAEVG